MDDIFILSLFLDGSVNFVETVGGDLNDEPGGIIYNSVRDRYQVVGYTESSAFQQSTGYDWIFYEFDYNGVNLCQEINLQNYTTKLLFIDATTTYSIVDVPVSLSFKTITT